MLSVSKIVLAEVRSDNLLSSYFTHGTEAQKEFSHPTGCNYTVSGKTRKLCYRKDDRAMPPCDIHGCPEIFFLDSLTTPIATISNIFRGLLFRSKL